MAAATYRVLDEGNRAIQAEVWTVPLAEAKAIARHFKSIGEDRPGGYWRHHVCTPVRRAARAKRASVEVWTGGFTTPELANACAAAGVEYGREFPVGD